MEGMHLSNRLLISLLPGALVALALFTPEPARAGEGDSERLPHQCDVLDDFGHSKYCEPTGPDLAPWWDAEVCCDDADCVEPGSEGCGDKSSVYCEFAELYGDGGVSCVVEVPTYCDTYGCTEEQSESGGMSYAPTPAEDWILCCYGWDNCYHTSGLCGGDLLYCYSAVSNQDGTTSCLDGDWL